MELTITTVGEKLALVFPDELASRQHLKAGDIVHCSETEDGFRITARDADFAECMEIVELIMQEDHELLKKLAE